MIGLPFSNANSTQLPDPPVAHLIIHTLDLEVKNFLSKIHADIVYIVSYLNYP